MFRKLTSAVDAMTIAPGMVMISLSAIALGAAFGGYPPVDRFVDGNPRSFIPTNWHC